MNALIFPGQGSQFEGMGKSMYDKYAQAREMFEEANEILGFRISDIMFDGGKEELKQTRVTQPAIFLHSWICMNVAEEMPAYSGVAGHSLGEITALTANKCLNWKDALHLVQARAIAMQHACELTEGTMAAVIGVEDAIVEEICRELNGIVIPANYNCPGQLVISGSLEGISRAAEKLKEAGARRVLPLSVGGAFHSYLMKPAREELKNAIERVKFNTPTCPIYQNVDGMPCSIPKEIKKRLIDQLISPVCWTQTMAKMTEDGYSKFWEVGGTGKVLGGMFKRFDGNIPTETLQC